MGARPSATQPADSGNVAEQARELLAPHLRRRHFAAGSLLWREGETSGLLVALETGRVKIYRLLPTGRAVTVFIFGPGDVFGFLPFLDGEPYPAYAQALEDVQAQVMSRDELLAAVRADPVVAVTLIGLVGRRLREAMRRIESLSSPGVLPRVASALVALLPDAGDHGGGAGIIRGPCPAASSRRPSASRRRPYPEASRGSCRCESSTASVPAGSRCSIPRRCARPPRASTRHERPCRDCATPPRSTTR